MQLAVLWAVCCCPGACTTLPQEAVGMSEQQWKRLRYDYLKRFYAFDSKTRDAKSLEGKLKEMQKFFGLPITGILNFQIIKIMQKPRCGVPDVAKYSLFPDGPKWTSKEVTYRIISYTRDLPRIRVDQLVTKALNTWSKEIPLRFKRVRWGVADIMIGFARGAHGDYYPFDGPGNTLAHAFAPGPGLGGDAHFDEDERWSDGSSLGVNFLYVATHELGHSLGLEHSSDPNSVMYPTYGYDDSQDFKLSQDDIKAIQKIYGFSGFVPAFISWVEKEVEAWNPEAQESPATVSRGSRDGNEEKEGLKKSLKEKRWSVREGLSRSV
ncbi:LOW QUALITY PROTEIN: matrilysin [Choloepus didactylus]|uniref:LOW QUALITY PROTEIN: matrilysin n=1 Tax=Choloepus didactylus TaxID=27675 RepID=UPI00189D4114|nr:LOW QUALITY PROTEIN: matrilysin [Choloepus didactylus]